MNNAAALGLPRIGALVAVTMSGLGGIWWKGSGYNETYVEPEPLPSVNTSSAFPSVNITDDNLSSSIPPSSNASVIDADCAHRITQRLAQAAEQHALHVADNAAQCQRAHEENLAQVAKQHTQHVADNAAQCQRAHEEKLAEVAKQHTLHVADNAAQCQRTLEENQANADSAFATQAEDFHKRLNAFDATRNATIEECQAAKLAADVLVADKATEVEACMVAKTTLHATHTQLLEDKRVSEERLMGRLTTCEQEKVKDSTDGKGEVRRQANACAAEVDSYKSRVDECEQKITVLEAENKWEQAQTAAAKKEAQDKADMLKQVEARKARVGEENTSLQAEKTRVEDENRSLQAEKTRVEDENRSLRTEKTRVEGENTSLRTEKTRVEEENTSLRTEKTRVEGENTSLRTEKTRVEGTHNGNTSTLVAMPGSATRKGTQGVNEGAQGVNEEDDSWMWILKEVVLFVSGLAVTLFHRRYEIRALKTKLKTAEDEKKKADEVTESLRAQIATTSEQVAAVEDTKKRALIKEIEGAVIASKEHRTQLTEMEMQMKDLAAEKLRMHETIAEKELAAAHEDNPGTLKEVELVVPELGKPMEHTMAESMGLLTQRHVSFGEPRQEAVTMTTPVVETEPATVMEPMEAQQKRDTEKLKPMAAKLARAIQMKKDLLLTMKRNDQMVPSEPCIEKKEVAINVEDEEKASAHNHDDDKRDVPVGTMEEKEHNKETPAGDTQSAHALDTPKEDEDVPTHAVDTTKEDEDVPADPVYTTKEDEDVLPHAVETTKEDEDVLPHAVETTKEDEDVLAHAVETKEDEDIRASADCENAHAAELPHATECHQWSVLQAEGVEPEEGAIYEEPEPAYTEPHTNDTDDRGVNDALRENIGNAAQPETVRANKTRKQKENRKTGKRSA